MTAHLPPSLLALFAPRPPLPYVVPEDKPKLPPYSGVSNYLSYFEDPVLINAPSGSRPFETRKQRKERIQKEKWEKNQLVIAQKIKEWAPSKDPKATGDPYKTLFVGRINYNTSELKLRKEFENWGSIKKIRLVLDQKGKPRGYAFVEFEREKDMKAAYKEADGKKIDGKRIVVDYERGRTSKSWRPRRFGGGRGFSRAGPDDLNQKYGQYRDGASSSRDGNRERSKERERSSERDKEKRSRHERGEKERPDRGVKRERERDRVGSERY